MEFHDNDDVLNVIDQLRSDGISRYIDLPQIIVVGEQSSGKSSSLEAISGICFPVRDGLCTRFATEVILRRTSTPRTSVSIRPGPNRSDDDKRRLSLYRRDANLEDVPRLVEEAHAIMGVDTQSRTFSSDVLKIEVSGPDQPHLTLVDLPGLFRASNKFQSDEDADVVTNLVLSYMKNPRSIILAVVSAKMEFSSQIVTKYAREVDPGGTRTLGLITKPDVLFPGSESEQSYLALAKNEDVKFKLGWHVVRNRDYDTRNATAVERDERERDFFEQGIWTQLDHGQVGVASLRWRASKLLRHQILIELPSLISDIRTRLSDCRNHLSYMGAPRSTISEQRTHLFRVSQRFSYLLQNSTKGSYLDEFFGDASTTLGYQKRLRAVVENSSLNFARNMRKKGHAKHIVEKVSSPKDPRSISTNAYLDRVDLLITRNRGTELPGTYNPQIIDVLFKEQSAPWADFAKDFADDIWDATNTTILLILNHVADSNTVMGLQKSILGQALNTLKEELDTSVEMILTQVQEGQATTYNHYFTDNIQEQRATRNSAILSKKLDDFFGTDTAKGKTACVNKTFDVKNLLLALAEHNQNDMDRYACTDATRCMRAYYKVAIKTFVDNIRILAIERCLLQPLMELFCPNDVMALDDVTIESIAKETHAATQDRIKTLAKEKSLVTALYALRRLSQSHLSTPVVVSDDDDDDDDEYVQELDEFEVVSDNVQTTPTLSTEPPSLALASSASAPPDTINSNRSAMENFRSSSTLQSNEQVTQETPPPVLTPKQAKKKMKIAS